MKEMQVTVTGWTLKRLTLNTTPTQRPLPKALGSTACARGSATSSLHIHIGHIPELATGLYYDPALPASEQKFLTNILIKHYQNQHV